MSEPVINVNPFLATAANAADLPLPKLKLHMLGPQINLFQGTPKITLDRQWNLSTSVALSLILENEDGIFFFLTCFSFSSQFLDETHNSNKSLALLIPLQPGILSQILSKTRYSGNKVWGL